ncbi:hypothetical protein ACLMJK_007072 [Lecanora helva]
MIAQISLLLFFFTLRALTSPFSPSTNSTSLMPSTKKGLTFQATITGYGPLCASPGSGYGSCGFLGSPSSYQAAVSTYWNTPGLSGQCGTCWRLSNGRNVNGDGTLGSVIGTAPIVVMVDNTCGKDPSKPTGRENGFQCNQNAAQPQDRFGSVTVVDLCHDTGAPEAFWGRTFDGTTGGLAVATIEEVDCESWEGSLDRFSDWTKYQLRGGSQKQVEVKAGKE